MKKSIYMKLEIFIIERLLNIERMFEKAIF